jgi:4-amino-4-deoxy-L-arabinose transferase-like glycosyltransferase
MATADPRGAGRRAHPLARVVARIDIALVVVVAAALFLAFWRLDAFPRTWFDEGIHLQAARNLVEDGTYAARSADGTLDYAPTIGVGPTLLLPVAGALDIGGNDLLAARIVPAAYLLIATILLYLVTRSLFGRLAAVATTLIIFTMPSLDWIETGRQVLGEVPALVFLLAGGICAARAKSRWAVAGAGLLLGLAMVTKGQYVLILPVTLVVLAAIDITRTRHRPAAWHVALFITAAATWVFWFATLLVIIGDGQIIETYRVLRQSSGGALLVFDIDRARAALKVLLGPSSYFLVAPAALVGMLGLRSARGDRQLALMGIWLFQATWLAWFAFASIGWPRYAFAGLAINAILMGSLVAQAGAIAAPALRRHAGWNWRSAGAAAALVAIAALVTLGAARTLAPVTDTSNAEPLEFVAVIEATTPANSVIDGWEPELGFLTDRPLQYPPPGTLDRVVRATWLGGQSPDLTPGLTGDYVIIGPFARWVGVYRGVEASPEYRLVSTVGPYQLFRHETQGSRQTSGGR